MACLGRGIHMKPHSLLLLLSPRSPSPSLSLISNNNMSQSMVNFLNLVGSPKLNQYSGYRCYCAPIFSPTDDLAKSGFKFQQVPELHDKLHRLESLTTGIFGLLLGDFEKAAGKCFLSLEVTICGFEDDGEIEESLGSIGRKVHKSAIYELEIKDAVDFLSQYQYYWTRVRSTVLLGWSDVFNGKAHTCDFKSSHYKDNCTVVTFHVAADSEINVKSGGICSSKELNKLLNQLITLDDDGKIRAFNVSCRYVNS